MNDNVIQMKNDKITDKEMCRMLDRQKRETTIKSFTPYWDYASGRTYIAPDESDSARVTMKKIKEKLI